MSNTYTNIISAQQLSDLIRAGRELLILDCRSKLGEPGWGAKQYQDGHIAGARFLDLDHDMAGTPGDGGRHPLPTLANWLATLGRLGFTANQQVVLYDDALGAYAARGWWMFRWAGYDHAAVLDGGLAAWPEPLTTESVASKTTHVEARKSLTNQIGAQELYAQLNALPGPLIDARAEARWAGEEEPIDAMAGHIPGAGCMPFSGNVGADGKFLPKDQLAQRFADLPDPVTCYCGSGVTACHNILALNIAGRDATLYVGSWSDWIRHADFPKAKR